jgi:hypothetical protein
MQNIYPDRQVDVELSDCNDNVLKEPTADGGGATSTKHIAPNPIGSNVLGQAYPSVIGQVDATAPTASGQKRKRPPPALKRKQSKPPVDQVMTQIGLPPYCGPRSPLNLVARTSVGGVAQPTKKTCGSPLKSVLAPR